MSTRFFPPRLQEVDSSGDVIFGSVEFLKKGTTDQIITYSDSERTTANSNPLDCDSNGRLPAVYFAPADIIAGITVNFYDAASGGGNLVYTDTDYDTRNGSDTALSIHPVSPEETAAGITPSDYSYRVGETRRYGTSGDGSTNDTSAILKWLKVGNQGVTLTDFAEDTYNLATWSRYAATGKITIKSKGATYKGTAATEFLWPTKGVNITGIVMNTWKRGFYTDNTVTDSADEIVIENSRFISFASNVVEHYGQVEAVSITNNRFKNVGDIVIRIGYNDYTKSTTYWNNVVITDNICNGIAASATSATVAFALVYGYRANISNNIITDIDGSSVITGECWGIYTKVIDKTINGNNITVKSGSTPPVFFGINCKGNPRDSTDDPKGHTGTIVGNTIECHSVVNSRGIQAASSDLLVANNHIDNARHGIRTLGGDTATDEDHSDIVITGNQINANYAVGDSDSIGIYLLNFGKRIKVSNNYIRTPDQYGIAVQPSAGKQIQYLSITNNEIEGSTVTDQGIRFAQDSSSSSTDVVIKGNEIRRCTTGIREAGTTACLSNVEITENTMVGVTNYWSFTNAVSGVAGNQRGISLQTPSDDVTAMFAIPVPDDSGLYLKARVIGKRADNNNVGIFEKHAGFEAASGTAAISSDSYENVVQHNTDLVADGVSLGASGANARLLVDGVSSVVVDWIADIEILNVV